MRLPIRSLVVLSAVAPALAVLAVTGCGRTLMVKAKLGNYLLTEVKSASTFNGAQAEQGTEFLVITLGRAPTGRGMISDDIEYFMEQPEESVVGPNGTRVARTAWAINDDSTVSLAYKIPAGSKSWKLEWRGNEPLDLGK